MVPGILCILRTSLSSVTGLSELVSSKRENWFVGQKKEGPPSDRSGLASLAPPVTREIIFENTFHYLSHKFPIY